MFVHFGIKDALDILLVGLLLYNIYKMMKDSGTINILPVLWPLSEFGSLLLGFWICVCSGR